MERLISRGRKFEISCPFFSFLTSYYLMKEIFCMTGGPLGRKPPFGYIEGFLQAFLKKMKFLPISWEKSAIFLQFNNRRR